MGWKQENDTWKWFDDSGKQITGWFKCSLDNSWYFLCSDDIMTGFLQDDDDRYYYFSPSQQIIDGKQYYKGQMVTGWIKYNEKQCYLYDGSRPDLGLYKGQCLIDGIYEMPYDKNKKYTFDKDGYLVEDNSGLSDKGAEFIGSWEGFYPKAYYDPYYPNNTNWITIGYGTTYAVTPKAFPNGINSTCTKQQALEWLKEEANDCYNKIKANLNSKGISLSASQMDSLTSFAYNCGTSALFGSSLYKNICNGVIDENTIMSCFRMWNKANGQYSNGLDRRRIREANIFSKGVYENN